MTDLMHQSVHNDKNPFVYGSIVVGKDFFGREKELDELANAVSSNRNVVIHSERRMGKTSLLAELARRHKKDFVFVHIDLRGASDEGGTIEALAKEVLKSGFMGMEELVPAIWALLGNSRLRLAVLESGEIAFAGGAQYESFVLATTKKATVPEKEGQDLKSLEIRMCPRCGAAMKWIDRYARHYCYRCKKYAPKQRIRRLASSPSPASLAKKRCPTCGSELQFVDKYSEYFCEVCTNYPLIEHRIKRAMKPTSLEITEALDLSEKIAVQKKKRFVVIFDEFQEVLSFDSPAFLTTMRNRMSMQNNVSYVFCCNSWSKTRALFEPENAAFSGFAKIIGLGRIPHDDITTYLMDKFKTAGGTLARELAVRVANLSGGCPLYVQHLAYELYQISNEPGPADLDAAITTAISHYSPHYSLVWDSLKSQLHRRYLHAIAAEPGVVHGIDFISRNSLRSRSHVQRIGKQLDARGITRYGEIIDPFFALWIRRLAP